MNTTCTGTIQSINELVNILWDTGVTQYLISRKMAEHLGNSFTRFLIPYRNIMLGNSKQIRISEAVKLTVQVQGHYLEFVCYVLPFHGENQNF